MKNFTPREIVSELDRFIIGQSNAKKAVAVALRNRWRRSKIADSALRREILPKNILMIGPTGVGKTEISRRLAALAQAPFVKVEATKFTEIGYVGRDVEQIIRDLVDMAVNLSKEEMYRAVKSEAEQKAVDKILDILVGPNAKDTSRENFHKQLIAGKLDDREVDVEVKNTPAVSQGVDIPGMPGAQLGMINIGDMFGKAMGQSTKRKTMKIKDAIKTLRDDISEDLIDNEKIQAEAIKVTEEHGIVFIDEIDKICGKSESQGRSGGEVSREGVQRDLLPLIEGCIVNTKYGQIRTDHILFITSGAFHVNKPSDLLPELQGRLPIRVNLLPLTKDDFIKILTEPENNLIKQYTKLMETENVELQFNDEAIEEIARLVVEINQNIENIGARRLYTILEKLLEDISFKASDSSGEKIIIDLEYVANNVSNLASSSDLSKFIL